MKLKHTSEEATQVNIINENNKAKNKNLGIERRDSTKKREDKQCTKSLILGWINFFFIERVVGELNVVIKRNLISKNRGQGKHVRTEQWYTPRGHVSRFNWRMRYISRLFDMMGKAVKKQRDKSLLPSVFLGEGFLIWCGIMV